MLGDEHSPPRSRQAIAIDMTTWGRRAESVTSCGTAASSSTFTSQAAFALHELGRDATSIPFMGYYELGLGIQTSGVVTTEDHLAVVPLGFVGRRASVESVARIR